MTATLQRPTRKPIEVRISDLIGQRHLELSDVDPSTPVSDIVGESRVRFSLMPSVDWQLRDGGTSRLLRSDQSIGDVAVEGKVDVTVQPDARLGR